PRPGRRAGRQGWRRFARAAGARPPLDDLAVAVHPAVAGVVQAKCDSAEALRRLDDALGAAEGRAGLAQGSLAVVPLIESAAGVLAMAALAAAPRVRRLQAGGGG